MLDEQKLGDSWEPYKAESSPGREMLAERNFARAANQIREW
jgi:hypothetical protein